MTRVPIIQLGAGGVGRALIRQVTANRKSHAERLNTRLDYVAITDRDGVLSSDAGLPDEVLATVSQKKAQGARLRELDGGRPWEGTADALDAAGDRGIVVDVSASDGTVPLLREARGRHLGIVLANKLPLCGSYETFQQLAPGDRSRFETTVAAALPVISTLERSLLDTGDNVHLIRGCVSGTLNILCQRLQEGQPLSRIVREAYAHGHTEPDPREDLAGRDAARKALILARILGHPLEHEDVEAASLYPPEMDLLPVDGFLDRLTELDEPYAEIAQQARERGCTLRYVLEVSGTGEPCRVGLRKLDADDVLIQPGVPDSVVAFETERYRNGPLIVRGRGSGPELTASGVLRDILDLTRSL